MKRMIGFLLIILCCFGLTACSSKSRKTDDLIEAIGTVTPASGDSIAAAEQAYLELSDTERAKVAKYGDLIAARETYDKLAAERELADSLAKRIITRMVSVFRSPLKTEINNVWFYHMELETAESWDFTFRLSVLDEFGTMTDVCYGMTLRVSDTTSDIEELDRILSDEAEFYEMLGTGVRWREDSVTAMQRGSELDAAEIQSYMRENYR